MGIAIKKIVKYQSEDLPVLFLKAGRELADLSELAKEFHNLGADLDHCSADSVRFLEAVYNCIR